jgi:polysaccharide export outer membrane protein
VHDTYVSLSRDGLTATVPLATLVGDPDEDIFARPGDVVTLQRRPQVLSVFGAAGKNAAVQFDQDRVSLGEALGKAAGLRDSRADPRAVFLLRYEPAAVARAVGAQPLPDAAAGGLTPVAYRLDLSDAKSFNLAQRFPVRDNDVIYIAEAPSEPLRKVLSVFQNITGPLLNAVLICHQTKC